MEKVPASQAPPGLRDDVETSVRAGGLPVNDFASGVDRHGATVTVTRRDQAGIRVGPRRADCCPGTGRSRSVPGFRVPGRRSVAAGPGTVPPGARPSQ